MRRLAILGSTGSIGKNCLEVARRLGPDQVKIEAIAAHQNIDLLEAQAKEFKPELIAVYCEKAAKILQARLPEFRVVAGMEGLQEVATLEKANLIISSMSGAIGIVPTLAAIRAKKRIGFANKEVLVSGGAFIMREVKEHGADLIPIDSELTALFQCLKGESSDAVSRLLITASGGPFRNHTAESLHKVTLEEALCHPNYRMGPKVTIDSSTLMNKGMEMIEAHYLFNMPSEKIEIVIHPEQVIHSMVEFTDNSMLAQMGFPDMIPPIQYAITYPNRLPGHLPPFDFIKYKQLNFILPDTQKFPCLALARAALQAGESVPCFMNGANETLVHKFLQKQITWKEIAQKLEAVLEKHTPQKLHSIDDVFGIDQEARRVANELCCVKY